ncbi:diaminopimelate epimerase [Salipaludibacillus aurantiacus]|uniref:Diaminopimelate epimerase n=1 Tax=Salipaludibacillus aurantiacus TaxID=1601833 RepID=A0A1H9RGY6_9BACI|nr:diaminopimelate epimerase [Salipaludibacillus aurantiacus]SER72060.1 diaminopimelate epimerase [Salipaludibacillus aurantiacus]
MKIDILKCHGSGNDFIIIDEMDEKYSFTDEERVKLTKQLAARNKLIGSDGTLFIQHSEQADARMRMFNTDGSEAEMCGNGLRCVARYVTEKMGRDTVIIETMKADLEVARVEEIFENIPTYEVAIEPVSLSPDIIPLKSDEPEHIDKPIKELHPSLTFTALSVPNPHIVTVVDEVNETDVRQIGEKANMLKEVLPNGVNVSFLKKVADGRVFVQTFERGVGLTNACGTAMSASSLVSCLLGLNQFDEKITVLNPGGMVQCLVHKDGQGDYFIRLRGNATYEFNASVKIDFSNPENAEILEKTAYEEEILNYAKLAEAAENMA